MRLSPSVLLHSTTRPSVARFFRHPGLAPQALTIGLALALLPPATRAQSSSSSTTPVQDQTSTSGRRGAQTEAAGSAITLETSEPLFDLAVALNSCGYDADLANSDPVRRDIRSAVAAAAAATPEATASQQALCAAIQQHVLGDPGRNAAQYVSLALYLTPGLTPTVDETELPPDSARVAAVLPSLRSFVQAVHLHAIYVEHRAAYEALVSRVHDPLTRMILDTNIYLHSPVSSYDGRRFLVLLEPMLAPSNTNARIYGPNYTIVVSPSAEGAFHIEQIRHTYLHYEIEPMVYARATAMDRLLPLLKPVANAPLEFTYKSDIVALLTECLIKAIEARTMDTGIARPRKPTGRLQRVEAERYQADLGASDRQSEAIRRQSVDLSLHQGWILTGYFYNQLIGMERDGVGLKDNIGPMVYGMDVDRERHAAQQIAFLPETSPEIVRRSGPAPTGLRLAEMKMMQGDSHTAGDIASKALADPAADHGTAHYILGRIDLLDRQPDDAVSHFQAALATGKDPHTLAWSHIYLGRLYDVQSNRKKALEEYSAALAVHDTAPDSRTAAAGGLKAPFALPKREAVTPATTDADDAPIDPSGKAEKDSYKPPPPSNPAPPQ